MTFKEDWDRICQNRGKEAALLSPDQAWTYQEIWQFCQASQEKEKDGSVIIDPKSPLEQALGLLRALYQEEAFLLLHPSLSPTEKDRLGQLFEKEVRQHPKQMGLLSSGSSGQAKLFWRKIESWTDFYPILNQAFPLLEKDGLYLQGSLSFTGNLNLLLAALLKGRPVFLDTQLDGALFLSYLRDYSLNKAYLIPSKIKLLLPFIKEAGLDEIWTSSQVLERGLVKEIKETLPETKVRVFYGSAELSYISWGLLDSLRAGSVGQLFPQIELESREGQLYLSSPFAIEGLPQPYASQDYGYMEGNQLILQGRGQDWVNQMGKKIYLPDLKEKIQAILARPVTLLGLDHPLAGQVPALVLEKGLDQDLTAIKKTLKKELAKEEWPRYFLEVESLPLLESGKIDYQELKNMLKKRT